MYNPSPSPALPVRLKFTHILSRLDFSVTFNNFSTDKIKVKKIELEDIDKTGTFSIKPASLTSGSSQTDDYDALWIDFRDKGTLSAEVNESVRPSTLDIPSLFPDTNALPVIPQPENNDIMMRLTYVLNADDPIHEFEETVVSKTPIGGWQSGKSYLYSLTVEPNTISMTVSVREWLAGSDDEVTVPRK